LCNAYANASHELNLSLTNFSRAAS